MAEAEPLLAFLRSWLNGMSPEQEWAVQREIETQLAAQGAIRIDLESSLVSGVKR